MIEYLKTSNNDKAIEYAWSRAAPYVIFIAFAVISLISKKHDNFRLDFLLFLLLLPLLLLQEIRGRHMLQSFESYFGLCMLWWYRHRLHHWFYLLIVRKNLIRNFVTGLNGTTCSFLLFYNNVVNGQNVQTTPKWVGITGIKNLLAQTSAKIDEISKAYPNAFSSNNWASTDSKNYMDSLTNSYNTFGTRTLNNPNPANSLKGGVTKITPLYIKLYGDYTKANTALNTIYKEFDTKITFAVTLMDKAKESSSYVNTYTDQIKSTLNDINSKVATFTSSFDEISSSIIDQWIDAQTRANDNGVAAFLGLFGVLIILAVLSAVFMIFLSICCNNKCLRILLHVLWNLMTIIMVLTFLLGGVFGLIGLVGVDGVPVMKYIFGSENLGSTSPKIITSTTASKYINICINSNGDLSKEFVPTSSYANSLDDLYKVSYNITQIKNAISANKNSEAIQYINTQYTNAINDITTSTDPTSGNNDISSILKDFNKWTDYNTNSNLNDCSTKPQDQWVQSPTLCPNGYAGDASLGSKSCLAYSKFTGASAGGRYSSLSGCKYTTSDFTSVTDAVSAYTTALNNYITDNTALLNEMISNNGNLNKDFVSMAEKLSNSLNRISGVIDPLYSLFQSVVGNNGMFALVNCGKKLIT